MQSLPRIDMISATIALRKRTAFFCTFDIGKNIPIGNQVAFFRNLKSSPFLNYQLTCALLLRHESSPSFLYAKGHISHCRKKTLVEIRHLMETLSKVIFVLKNNCSCAFLA